MTGGVLGGGVIFVVAALLWAAVLVPTWMRRREFRAAERNALRLQRTLRVLAETSEVPQEVRLEATAKQALAHEKLLRTAQKRQDAEREADLAEAQAEQLRAEIRAQEMKRRHAATQRAARLRKPVMRRMRALAALVALCGLVGVLVGVGFAIGGSGAGVLGWSAAFATIGTGALVLLAPGRGRVRIVAEPHLPEVVSTPVEVATEDDETEDLDDLRGAEAHAEAQQAASERIERARALARARAVRPAARENQTDSILLREAREQVSRARAAENAGAAAGAGSVGSVGSVGTSAVSSSAPAAAQASGESGTAERTARPAATTPRRAPMSAETARQQAASERLRRMGVIGDTSEGMPDLDAVLRRRRNAS